MTESFQREPSEGGGSLLWGGSQAGGGGELPPELSQALLEYKLVLMNKQARLGCVVVVVCVCVWGGGIVA